MNDFSDNILILDDFRIDIKNRQVSHHGSILSLNTKYFDVLVYLIQNNNRLITKDELFLKIWGDSFVTDTALSQCIKDIRKILNDDAKNPHYLKTVPKHGFIFIGVPQDFTTDKKIATEYRITKRPYKFLDYFTEQDVDIFFGREQEINELCSKIINHRSFLIYGRSGVGKSSITHAGLIPELKRQGHHAFVIRSFSDPVKELDELLYNKSRNDLNESDNNIICFWDQFEDFFLLAKPEIRKKFINKIHSVYKTNNTNFRLVFVIREDLLAEMNVFKEILPEVFFHEHRLQRLNFEQSRKAILEPAKLMDLQFEESLVEKIILDLSENEFIDPPQLQIICDTLFDKRNSSPIISLKIYENLEGAKQILAGYLEQVLKHFQKSDLDSVKNILLNLINEKSEKQILTIDKLKQLQSGRCTENNFQELIEELSAHRIIRIFRLEGETWIELTHDFLAPEILKWQSAEIIAIKQAKKLFERAFDNFNNHKLLPGKETISLILPMAEKIIIDKEKYDFLLTCLLNLGQQLPKWLIEKSTNAKQQILKTIHNKKPEIRINAIESFNYLRDEELKQRIKKAALADTESSVRKSAAIVLADSFGTQAIEVLTDKSDSTNYSLIQQAISLAFIRDYNKKLINLKKINPIISLIILSGLMWVRFRRHQNEIFSRSFRAASGTALSGFIVGTLLGLLLIIYRNLPTFESTTILLSLTSLGVISGLVVGFGIAFGMLSLKFVGHRHSKWWSMIGAIMGGWIIGGVINIIGVDLFVSLSGQKLSGLAGAFEAAAIGFGLSIGYLISENYANHKNWIRILYPALGSMIVAIILTLIEGSLFSASIEKIAESFIESKIDFKPIANLFGEKYFGQISRLSLAAFEGFIFGASFYIADKFRFLFVKG
jgi:DNA-binding winged helix-turn-helix (wHTH) protein